MLKGKELDYHLNDSGAKVLVCLESLYETVAREVVPGTNVQHLLTTSELGFLPKGRPEMFERAEKKHPEGTTDLMKALRETEPDTGVRPTPEDTAYLVYTSGTTGRPKGAIETHSNVAFNAEAHRAWIWIGDDDSVFGVAPLFHITGLVGHTALAGLAGVPLVLFHDGYFLTGDVAVMNEDGWFYILDRKKDMINVAGYKVWPREVEDVLYTRRSRRPPSACRTSTGARPSKPSWLSKRETRSPRTNWSRTVRSGWPTTSIPER